jgi:branched-chain amino acid transport system substrate-binding protein
MDNFNRLLEALRSSRLSRREFFVRAAAMGLSASAIAHWMAHAESPEPTEEAMLDWTPGPKATPNSDVPKVNVGLLYPQTGDYARFGIACTNATKLALKHINEAGGIMSMGGAELNVIIEDATSDATQARSQAERLITQNKLAAGTGCYSSSITLVVTEVSERNKLPWITGSISDKLTDRAFKYFFQVSPKASMFGQMQVETAKLLGDEIGPQLSKVAIVYEDTSYGTSTSEGLSSTAEALGFDIVLSEAYSAGFTDASPLVNKIKASGAEIIFPVSYLTDAILIVKTMRDMDVNAATIGGGAGYLMPEFWQGLGTDAEYIFSVGSWAMDISCPSVPWFATAYEEEYGEFLMEHAGEAYVMLWVIKEALEKAASDDPEKVREAMASLDLTMGPASAMPGCHVQFDDVGWNYHVHPVMIQWRDGRPACVWPPEDARIAPVWPIPTWEERKKAQS